MKVLLADDSDWILDRLKEIIGKFKRAQIVGVIKDGAEILDSLRNLKPDLAIVNMKMPGLFGLKVLSEIRKENRSVKFIILTFYASEYYRQLAIQAGADYFFFKLDDFEKVALVVEEMVLKEEYYNRMKITST